MATPFYDNIFVQSAKLIDAKWGPFASLTDAYSAVPTAARQIGMFAIIAPTGGGAAQLYWYKNNTTTLVPFAGNSSVEVYATYANFPATGLENVIYIDKSESKSYYWNNAGSPPAYVLTSSTIEVYDDLTLFPGTGVEGVIYIADDTNISYLWNPALLNGVGDYEAISGIIKQVELQSDGTYIQWRYVGDPSWINLVALNDLKGADGIDGIDGVDGAQGEIGFPGFKYDIRRVLANEYKIGEIIEYNGSYFICLANNDAIPPTGGNIGVYWNPYSFVGPQGPQGIPGADGADGVTPDWYFQYAYDPATTYVVGDIVTYNGETWYALQGLAPGTTPVEGVNWTKLAAKGADGTGGSGGGVLHGTASGTDTYTVTITGVTAYADGDAYLIRFTNGNTAASPTLNINSIGAKVLYRNNDGQLLGGDIVAGGEMLCVYNSTLDVFQCIGTAPNTLFAYITNADSVTITKGQPVYAFSGAGDRMSVKLAYNTLDSTSAQTVGLVYSASIAAGQKGLIIIQGLLDGLSILPDTTWDDGDPVYLGTTAGSITKTKPYAPNHLVYLGVVTTASNGSSGRMYVRVQNGYELDEIHDIDLKTTTPTTGDYIYFNSAGLWVNSKDWQGNTIPVTKGGTGLISATASSIFLSDGSGVPYWGTTLPSFSVGISSSSTGVITLLNASHVNTLAIQSSTSQSASYTLTLPVTAGSAGQYLQTNGSGVLSWVTGTSVGGVTTVGAFSASAQTNGATISSTTITFGPASATVPGMVSTGTQTWAGAKTLSGAVTISSATTSAPSLTLSAAGAAANSSQLTFTGLTMRSIDFGSSGGSALPTITTNRSVGTKLILNNSFSAGTLTDAAIGIGTNILWNSIPSNTTTYSFRWYGGATEIMSLRGDGLLTLTGTMTVTGAAEAAVASIYHTSLGTTNFLGYFIRRTTGSFLVSGLVLGRSSSDTLPSLLFSGEGFTSYAWISFGTAPNENTPTFTTRSTGTRIVLKATHDGATGTTTDIAIGTGGQFTSNMWFSVPQSVAGGSNNFRFYAGETLVFTIGGTGNLTLADAANIVLNTTTGTKIGTAANQKIGFFNAAPVAQQTGGALTAAATYGTNEQTMLNRAYTALRNLGLIS
jgi:hypothetical protein